MRVFSGDHTNKDLGSTVVFVTGMLKELRDRTGGNPFDNRGVVYESMTDQNALNRGVKRYAADPKAAEYVRAWYTPTGKLFHPMLAIHTSYDPLVLVRIPNQYPGIVSAAGSRDLFVQEYVEHDGHCAITAPETERGFSALRDWKAKGIKPVGGLLPAATSASASAPAQ